MNDFIAREQEAQSAYFARTLPAHVAGFGGSAYRLMPENRTLNLAPEIRDVANAYFSEHGITWHQHANHALSSQVCCLNFFMPLATQPQLLAQIIGQALQIAPPTMLEVETGPEGRPWFIGFEWIGRHDYLNEAGKSGTRTRGANATSADAIIRFIHNGQVETVLIEWKYTERYGASIPSKGNETRVGRYQDLVFAPKGPIRSDTQLDLRSFFWEPFYQLLRQQMLAFQMQQTGEDKTTRVRVLHISPVGNRALHLVTAPAFKQHGSDAFKVFSNMLVRPEDFIACSTEDIFGPFLSSASSEAHSQWAAYISERYRVRSSA